MQQSVQYMIWDYQWQSRQMRRLAGKTISSLSPLDALLIHWRNIQFSHQCQLSSACRDAIRGRQWYLNCFINIFPWHNAFCSSPSSMAHHVSHLLHLTNDQLVLFQSTCLDSSFRGYSFVNFRIGFVICSSSRTDFICLVSLYGRTDPLEQMPGPI